MNIGEHMRFLREEKGYSLKKVEMLTGIDNGNLSRYERNLNIPNIEFCMQLAKLYGVSLDALSDDEQKLLNLYQRMSHQQKIRAVAYCEGLLSTSANLSKPRIS